jgi:hypothetical protein
MRRLVAILGMIAILAFAAGPVMAGGNQHRPFTGTAWGHGMVVPDASCPAFGGLRSVFTQTGYASHMGEIVIDNSHCTPAGPMIGGGQMTIAAANGDTVSITYTGGPSPAVGPDPMRFDVPIEFTVVGGTGRFVGATGGGHMTVTISWPGFEPNFWPDKIVFDGTIGY